VSAYWVKEAGEGVEDLRVLAAAGGGGHRADVERQAPHQLPGGQLMQLEDVLHVVLVAHQKEALRRTEAISIRYL
jgi:hypothetical protein